MQEEPINFTDIDAGNLKDNLLAQMENATGELLYPGDERRIFAEGMAYALSVLVSSMNEACKSRLLTYARGKVLVAGGERVGCSRLSPTPARTILKFSLAAERTVPTIIPAGTRCTADNTIYFATDSAAMIPTGAMTVEVAATATEGGIKTNGIPAGGVQTFADDVPFVAGVVNIAESAGGDDGEPYPSAIDPVNGDDGTGDNHYRERIRLAPSGFTTAGTAGAYSYFAKSASANVADVKVISEQEAGTVLLVICEAHGADPSEATLQEVFTAVTADDVKPLGDKVSVSAPSPIEYGIELTYYCSKPEQSETVQAIEGAGGAIEQYREWQNSVIGRDINPDRLRAFLLDTCIRVDVKAPVFTSVSDLQIPRWNGRINVSHVTIEE